MAAWSDHEYRDDVLEDFGQHVRVSDDYTEWDGALTDAITEASMLCDDIPFTLEGGLGQGSAAPAPSETLDLEAVAAAGLHDAFVEIAALLDRAAAA